VMFLNFMCLLQGREFRLWQAL